MKAIRSAPLNEESHKHIEKWQTIYWDIASEVQYMQCILIYTYNSSTDVLHVRMQMCS